MRANFKEVSRWLMSGGLLLAGTFAHGNTITINSDGDAANANVFGTSCNTGSTVTIPGAGTVPECTLRAAIQVANNLSSSTIQYASALSCSDLNQIRLQSSLPGIGSPLVVDASTHPCAGGSANWYPTIIPDIVSGATINFGLTIGADNVTIERMEFGFFEIAGILVDGNNVTLDNVQSSLNGLGLVFSGADGGLVINSTFSNNDGDNVRLSSSQGVALRNNWISSSDGAGIAILNGSSGNSIGSLSGTPPASNCQGNSIFSNAESGIFVDSDSDGQVIVCNTIFSNEGNGITLESDDNRVGSAADLGELDITPMGNIIRSNDGNGIQMGMNSHGNIISRNTIGGEAGESNQGNGLNGLSILGGNSGIQEIRENTIGYNGLDGIRILGNGWAAIRGNYVRGNQINGIRSSRHVTRIGGVDEAESNTIILNELNGILISNSSGLGFPSIGGNFIGTDVDGNSLGNGSHGIRIDEVNVTTYIGQMSLSGTPSAPNVIGFNGQSGITVSASENVRIHGNYIGTNASGMNLGNQRHGVYLLSGGKGRVGHTATAPVSPPIEGSGNIIAYNQDAGIRLTNPLTRDVPLRGNSIFANGGRGIELQDNGNVIDPGGSQNGPNRRQNYPEFVDLETFFNAASGSVEFSYRVRTDTINAAYPLLIDFYLIEGTSPQGKVWLGSDSYPASSANEYRSGSFQPSSWSGSLSGARITATATDNDGNTSEFNPFSVSLEQLGDEIFRDRFENSN